MGLSNALIINQGTISYNTATGDADIPYAFYTRKMLLTEYGFLFPLSFEAFDILSYLETGKYIGINSKMLKGTKVDLLGAVLTPDFKLHVFTGGVKGIIPVVIPITFDSRMIKTSGYFLQLFSTIGFDLGHTNEQILDIGSKACIRFPAPSRWDSFTLDDFKVMCEGKEFKPIPFYSPSPKQYY